MDFNKIKEMGLEYAEKGKNAAMDLAERGKTQAKIVNEQTKLARAQRQLGALVYSLAKGNEENQPLVDKYIEMIDAIEKNLAALREHRDARSGSCPGTRSTGGQRDHRVPHRRTACCRGKEDLPAVWCAGLGRCTVLQQVRRAAVT